MSEPLHLTPLERYADDLIRFENFERYVAQSAATRVNLVGTLPARPPYDHGGPRAVVPYEARRGE